MKYMLDTNIIIYAKNNRPELVLKKLRQFKPEDLCISAISVAELEYGAENSSRPEINRAALYVLLSNISVLPFDSNSAYEYGKIRHFLKARGEMIGSNDLLIAAHAKANNLTLVTNNTNEFERVPGLKIENWIV